MQTSTWAVLLVTLVGLTEVAGIPSGARKPDCHLYYVPFCPRNYEPICGSDGVTYPNECTLCAENEINPGVFIIKEAAC